MREKGGGPLLALGGELSPRNPPRAQFLCRALARLRPTCNVNVRLSRARFHLCLRPAPSAPRGSSRRGVEDIVRTFRRDVLNDAMPFVVCVLLPMIPSRTCCAGTASNQAR